MSRTLSLLIVLIILVGAFLVIRYAKDTFQTPSTQENALTPSQAKNPTEFQKWREFSSPDSHFKVLLPSLPQHIVEQIPDPKTQEPRKYETFIASDSVGPAFMISAITFPKNVETDERDILKAIVDEMLARNKDNKLEKMKYGTFHNHKSLDFTMNNKDITIAGKVFADGKTVYIVSMISNSSIFNPQELDFFVNSFDITKPTNP